MSLFKADARRLPPGFKAKMTAALETAEEMREQLNARDARVTELENAMAEVGVYVSILSSTMDMLNDHLDTGLRVPAAAVTRSGDVTENVDSVCSVIKSATMVGALACHYIEGIERSNSESLETLIGLKELFVRSSRPARPVPTLSAAIHKIEQMSQESEHEGEEGGDNVYSPSTPLAQSGLELDLARMATYQQFTQGRDD